MQDALLASGFFLIGYGAGGGSEDCRWFVNTGSNVIIVRLGGYTLLILKLRWFAASTGEVDVYLSLFESLILLGSRMIFFLGNRSSIVCREVSWLYILGTGMVLARCLSSEAYC